MDRNFVFTSESVSAGHPDKIADGISDLILDSILEKDRNARVACETMVKTGLVVISGEISTNCWVDVEALVRKYICSLGYDRSEVGFDGNLCGVLNAIGKQSPDIAVGVNKKDDIGAGDQGIMFGYACDDTPDLMPAPIYYAHALMKQHDKVKKQKKCDFILPDAKSQVTFLYENGIPKKIVKLLISTQHKPEVSLKKLKEAVIDEIILKAIPKHLVHKNMEILINPTGKFTIGGPMGDCGLTGRKIIVDSYGGMARHGGGAFSGKDPTKVDRSGAYYARYVAKNIVASGIAKKCEIQISYAIGVSTPLSLFINTFGTGEIPDDKIENIIVDLFDFRPFSIIKNLNLTKVKYLETSNYGHFGKRGKNFTWEKTDHAEELADLVL